MNQDERLNNMRGSARCGAKTRAGGQCQCPAIRGRTRCRIHGGRSPGAPHGKKNGNFKEGFFTCEAVKERKWARDLINTHEGNRQVTETLPQPANISKSSNSRTRVKLRRVNSDLSKPYPPDGDEQRWWGRLKTALGTTSSDFVNATLIQIQNASRMPSGGISEISVNAVLAFVEAAEPKNEMEAALAIQMACTHAAAMAVLNRVGGAYGGDRHVSLMATAAARLLNAFTAQVETLRRVRNGSSQYMRVEHIHLEPGAQAIIGKVEKT